jgi:hypothetical protein
MTERRAVSRRTGLKGLGMIGAAIALGGPAAAQNAGDARADKPKPATSVADVAAARMAKGHS